MFFVLNNNILVEVDIHKTDPNAENILTNFLVRGKTEGRSKITKFELTSNTSTSSNSNITQSYSVLTCEDSKNLKSVWKFSEAIICFKIRPKVLNSIRPMDSKYKNYFSNNNFIAISFNGGKLKVFNYESRMLIYEYKTNYGNVIGIEYSRDGKLLGLGTESDNVYILDAEFGNLLYCLEGHKNYVTSLAFGEVIEEESVENNLPEQNLNESIDNYASLASNYHRNNTFINKELSTKDFSFLLNDQDDSNNTLDIKMLRRSRTSLKNCLNLSGALVENKIKEMNFISSYDLFTTGLDGYLSVWRIEYFFDQEINEKIYYNHPNSNNKEQTSNIRIEQPAIINLYPSESIKLFYSDMKKIKNAPINYFYLFDNTIVYLSQRNINSSTYHLYFYSGQIIDENSTQEAKNNTGSTANKNSENFKRSVSSSAFNTSDVRRSSSKDKSKMSSSVMVDQRKAYKTNDSPKNITEKKK
jgi:hypothetical protein